MTELALHILDIAKNSTRAKATEVKIEVIASTAQDKLKITISDDGSGMDEELLEKVTDPFATTRTTRKVGLGIPLFRQSALMAEGDFSIESELGVGTKTYAEFKLSHIDRVPLGDLPGSLVTLIGGSPEVDFILYYEVDGKSYEFSTVPVREIMEGISLAEPEILAYIEDMIAQNIENINGGIII